MHLNIEISILIQNFGIDHELNVKREGRKIMNTIVYNDDNWLFPNQPLKTHDISYDDIQHLLNCADIDDRWADNIQKMVQDRDEHPEKRGDISSRKFHQQWLESCDEAEKEVIYQSSYKTYIFMSKAIGLLLIVTMLSHLFFKTGIMAILVVGVMYLVLVVTA